MEGSQFWSKQRAGGETCRPLFVRSAFGEYMTAVIFPLTEIVTAVTFHLGADFVRLPQKDAKERKYGT
jgi:hypothetical protein